MIITCNGIAVKAEYGSDWHIEKGNVLFDTDSDMGKDRDGPGQGMMEYGQVPGI